MEWTSAQLEAIGARGSNLLVSAAAGSGKTAVLTARIIDLVREGACMDDFLVVTFTKAAAAEMRARIMTALHDGADAGDRRFAEQAMRVEWASISTLHGFCGEVCRKHFQAAGVDPTFRVADAAEVGVLRAQALSEALRECFAAPTEPFHYVAGCLSQQELTSAVEELHAFLMAKPDPWEWLEDAVMAHAMDAASIKTSNWMDEVIRGIVLALDDALALQDELVAYAENTGLFLSFTNDERESIKRYRAAAEAGYDALMMHGPYTFGRRPSKKKGDDETGIEHYDGMRDHVKKRLAGASKLAEWLDPLENRALDQCVNGVMLRGLQSAALAFHDRFQALKAEKNVMDFNDLEHFAIKALREPAIAEYYRQKYKHVFVDEYQDSSMLQEALLQSVSSGHNLFMVGDVKQSVYRFRLAEPALFLNKLCGFSAEAGAKDRKIILNTNYRSHSMLIHGINAIFERVFIGREMEIQYDEEAHLYPGCAQDWPGARAELHLLLKDDEQNESEEEDEDTSDLLMGEVKTAIQAEAEWMADRIIALREAPERAYRPRDIAILMRTVRGKARQVVETLRKRGIHAWSDLSENALEHGEVRSILSLLSVIDNMRQDLYLMASLKGPACGLTDAQIGEIRGTEPDSTFADAVLRYAKRNDELAEALRQFTLRVHDWSIDAQVLPLDEFIQRLYMDTGYYADVGALPDGDRRQANLRMLAEHAGDYQRTQGSGLPGFLRYIERVKEKEGIDVADLGERDDVVRVMSIHKSKGLQFPVVFLAGVGARFGRGAKGETLVAHNTLGIGMKAIEPEIRRVQETLAWRAIKEKRRQEGAAEEARILYVALTRAMSRLILVGTSARKDVERWEALSRSSGGSYAMSQLDWIAPAAWGNAHWLVETHRVEQRAVENAYQSSIHKIAEDARQARRGDASAMIWKALSWQVPEVRVAPLKRSVTAIVRESFAGGGEESPCGQIADEAKRPLFMEEKGLSPTERGSAVHAFLHLAPLDIDDIGRELDELVTKGIFSEAQAKDMPVEKIEKIINSDIWRRMRKSKEVHREWAFNLKAEDDGSVYLIQGIVDCCFWEKDGWVLMDYKSDHVEDPETLVERYRAQIGQYGAAIEKLTGKPVKEKVLYFLDTSSGYSV